MNTERRFFRYDTSGHWYKGNVHIHSTVSDGGKDFRELSDMYRAKGYDFLFRTDHNVPSDVSRDKEEYPLLWLDGIEINGPDETGTPFHVVCLGDARDLNRQEGFAVSLESARQMGLLLILAHPHWMGNSLEDARKWNFDGVEIYNHVCHWLNGKSNGLVYWETVLKEKRDTLAFAVDDAHITVEHPGWNGGWIVVNAPRCSAEDLLAAIRRGNFYSSCGPVLELISFDGEQLHLQTSPIRFARLVGPGSLGDRRGSFDGQVMTDISIPVPEDWPYVYAEIEDENGRRAWTNTLFLSEKPSNRTDPGNGK